MTDHSEMSSYHRERLIRAQHQQLKKIDAADDKFFERFPLRQHRFRLAARAEIERASFAGAIANLLPRGSKHYAMPKSQAAGMCMLIMYAIGPESLDTDVSEAKAREYFEAVNRRELRQMAELNLSSAWSARNG